MRKPQTVRIIGGKWRSRQVAFPSLTGLRPTSDRLRETLFNWLSADLVGARCLDVFAGSGVLGFEAASRGAAAVIMIESQQQIIMTLLETKKKLDADVVEILRGSAPDVFTRLSGVFDVIFLDPPFDSRLQDTCLSTLSDLPLVNDQTLIYVESPTLLSETVLHPVWKVKKQTCVGNVFAYLLQRGLEKTLT